MAPDDGELGPARAEVPGCLWMPAHPQNYHLRPQPQLRDGYRLLVEHITSGHGKAEDVAIMWQRPALDPTHTCAHFVIGQDGTCIQCVPLRFAAQHAHAANAYSVGIEHCCREPGELGPSDLGLPPSDALYLASARLNAYLLVAGGLQPTRQYVQGHAQADPQTTHTGCPDSVWDWPRYMDLVVAAYRAV